MIMEDVAENVVTIGDALEVGQFRIKESAKAFAILSSSLYKNKIRAIIRELSCNARDSRVAAGLDEKFSVHLPTRMEPEFFVKDQGTGLTHAEVMSLYTTYFESTKTTSNEFVGALGLGSKSPFSYTENFTVTAIKDGVRGVYSAFINEIGMPSIVCLFSGPTDEPNGVEVRIPVAEKDHREFLNEASYVFNWFNVKPDCNMSLNSYGISETKHDYYSENSSNRSLILMGGVSYEFDMSDFVPNAVSIKFLFRMGIGDVDVLPSREGLQNTAKTKSAIIGTYNRIYDLEQSKIELELEKIDTVYEKISYLNIIDSVMGKHIRGLLKNKKFPRTDTINFDKLHTINLKCSTYSSNSGRKNPKAINIAAITPSPHVKFIYNDMGLAMSTIKDQFDSEGCTVFIFTKLDKNLSADFEAFRVTSLLGADVVLASSCLTKPTRAVSYTKRKKNCGVMCAVAHKSKGYYGNEKYRLTVQDTDYMDDVKFYVRLNDDNDVVHNGVKVRINSIIDLFGSHRTVFLKPKSKFDTTGLTECFAHVAEYQPIRSKFVVEFGYENRGFCDLVEFIHRSNIIIEDAALEEIIREYVSYTTTPAETKIDKFMGQYPLLYPLDSRPDYDDGKIDTAIKKYGMITVSDSSVNPSLIETLINTIHNHETKD